MSAGDLALLIILGGAVVALAVGALTDVAKRAWRAYRVSHMIPEPWWEDVALRSYSVALGASLGWGLGAWQEAPLAGAVVGLAAGSWTTITYARLAARRAAAAAGGPALDQGPAPAPDHEP